MSDTELVLTMLAEASILDPNLTRDRAVQLSGMNRNRLAKVVQEYSGTNFSGFINLMRLEYSLALLEKSDSTVETVALDSGFGNVRTYHRLFKERFGMTPTEYREASARLRGKSGHLPDIYHRNFQSTIKSHGKHHQSH